MFQHSFLDSREPIRAGKVVCVGRNYLDHINELGNPIPENPILFMKPTSSLVELSEPIRLPNYSNECHHELEISVLIGKKVDCNTKDIENTILGYGVALDLTLRDIQDTLKKQGHPWERAKAFDGSCPISPFVPKEKFPNAKDISFSLKVNGELRQKSNSQLMMYGIIALIEHIAQCFTLFPGDVVLTGTPKGVKSLKPGDQLELNLQDEYTFSTHVL